MAALKYKKKKKKRNLYSLDFLRPNGRLSQNPKTEGFRELCLPKTDFKTYSIINVPKNIQILDTWKPTEDMKLRLEIFFTCPSTYELKIVF